MTDTVACLVADRRLAAMARAHQRLDAARSSPKRRRALITCSQLALDRMGTSRKRLHTTVVAQPAKPAHKKELFVAADDGGDASMALTRRIDDLSIVFTNGSVAPLQTDEFRQLQVLTLIHSIDSANTPHDATNTPHDAVDSDECLVCAESVLHRVIDTDPSHCCAVARGAVCVHCIARHTTTSRRCLLCRHAWSVTTMSCTSRRR